MSHCEFGSIHFGPCDLGNTAIDMGNYVNVCAICPNLQGVDDL
jgi:hypothetical protein